MGSWSVCCGISNIAITSGNKCVLLPLKENKTSETMAWQPATLPIFGNYNDYGGIEGIEKDDNTALIESHFGVSIDEFCEFLVDGKFTYDRDEAEEIAERMENSKEASEWRFMWIDRHVYDFMKIYGNEYHKGYMDYGTPEMLKLFGFELAGQSDNYDNYDPKRFKQLWKKGDVELFSDGSTILAGKNRYVYHFGKGDESSIETYFEVPKELEYLKNTSKEETWRLMSKKKVKSEIGWILASRYDFSSLEDLLMETAKDIDIKKIERKFPLYKKYVNDLDAFGDRVVHLINILTNLFPMSGQFTPHVLYLTPQCGEYKQHQKILEKFAEINKSYIDFEEDDE